MSRRCQSCGIPMQAKRSGDMRGTEQDGSKSSKWCSLCYANGEFLGPDCTVEQMIAIVDEALKQQGKSPVMRWLARSGIPRLERWKS